jgi:hypothetical protein
VSTYWDEDLKPHLGYFEEFSYFCSVLHHKVDPLRYIMLTENAPSSFDAIALVLILKFGVSMHGDVQPTKKH